MIGKVLKMLVFLAFSVESFASNHSQLPTVDSDVTELERNLANFPHDVELWKDLTAYRPDDTVQKPKNKAMLVLYNVIHELGFWKQIDSKNALLDPSEDQKTEDIRCTRKMYIEDLSKDFAKLSFEVFNEETKAMLSPYARRIVMSSQLLNSLCAGNVSEFYAMWRDVSSKDFEELEKVIIEKSSTEP